jgi:hypothetical protein
MDRGMKMNRLVYGRRSEARFCCERVLETDRLPPPPTTTANTDACCLLPLVPRTETDDEELDMEPRRPRME